MRLKWAVMKVRVVQQEPATFARLPSVLEDIPDGGYFNKSAGRSRVTSDSAQGIPGADGRAGDQRTLYAFFHSSSFRPCARSVSFPLHRLDRLFRPRLAQLSRSNRSHIWADRGGNGRDHMGISLHGGKRRTG